MIFNLGGRGEIYINFKWPIEPNGKLAIFDHGVNDNDISLGYCLLVFGRVKSLYSDGSCLTLFRPGLK
jgi:hypothetical protein